MLFPTAKCPGFASLLLPNMPRYKDHNPFSSLSQHCQTLFILTLCLLWDFSALVFHMLYVCRLVFIFIFFSSETNLFSFTSRCEVRSHYTTLVYDCLSMNESGNNGTNVCYYQTSATEGVKTF